MQTILGSGGTIGRDLAVELRQYTDDIRLVSRHPKKILPTDAVYPADLTQEDRTLKAVRGSEIVYLTAGLEYRAAVWKRDWPRIMENVLKACREFGSKLVFFDNVYMYDPEKMGHMTEETPIRPVSKKGKVRARLVQMVMDAVERGDIQAQIVRSADFYGPENHNSVLVETVPKNLEVGKKAIWFGSGDHPHSFTFSPDAARATALLGNTPEAYDQVWHLPTAPDPPTGKEWIEMFADEMNAEPKMQVVPVWMLRLMGLFNPMMRELGEMAYQYNRDYIFDSSKFAGRFQLAPTPYEKGVAEVASEFTHS